MAQPPKNNILKDAREENRAAISKLAREQKRTPTCQRMIDSMMKRAAAKDKEQEQEQKNK